VHSSPGVLVPTEGPGEQNRRRAIIPIAAMYESGGLTRAEDNAEGLHEWKTTRRAYASGRQGGLFADTPISDIAVANVQCRGAREETHERVKKDHEGKVLRRKGKRGEAGTSAVCDRLSSAPRNRRERKLTPSARVDLGRDAGERSVDDQLHADGVCCDVYEVVWGEDATRGSWRRKDGGEGG
jgi:hypothetical protein